MAINLDDEPDETVRTPGKGESPAGWDRYTQNSQKIYQGFVDANLAAGMSPEDARNRASEQYQQWGQAQHEQMYSDANAAPFGIKELAPLAGNNGLNAPLAVLTAGLTSMAAGETILADGAATGETATGLSTVGGETGAETVAAETGLETASEVSTAATGGSAAADTASGAAATEGMTIEPPPIEPVEEPPPLDVAHDAMVVEPPPIEPVGEPGPLPTPEGMPVPDPAGPEILTKVLSAGGRVAADILLTQVLGLLNGKKAASDSLDNQARGALINAISNVEPIPVVYGSRRKAGAIVLLEVTGASNEYLNVVVVWGEGPISAINTLYLNDVSAADSRFSGLVDRYDHLGSDTQAADAVLTAEIANSAKWSSACTLSGVAYTYLRLKWSNSAFSGGLPNITADIDGRTLYDPRTATTAFSHNPALAIRDYLTNTRYGRGIDAATMIDDTAFNAAANYCDALVSIPGGGTQARYTADGIVDVDQKPIDNLRALLTSCRGFLVFSGGQYKLKIDKAETPVSLTLSEDNIIGGWQVSLGSKRTRYNRVKARFFNPAASWQPDIAIQDSSAFRTLDNGLLLEASQLELPFTTDAYRAGQIAQIEMKRSRFGIVATLTATIAAMALEVGDVVPVTHATFGWVAKSFRVLEIELLSTDEVRLTLLEYDDSVYTLDALTAVVTPPTASLPNPNTVGAPGTPSITEALYQTTGSAGVKSRATVSWQASADIYVQQGGYYQLERSPTGTGTWTVFSRIQSPGTGTVSYSIDDMKPAVYDWRVRAFNSLDVASSYSATTTKEIFGLTAAPSDLTNFAVQNYAGVAKFTWSKPSSNSDLDVVQGGRIYVRWTPKVVGYDWDYGVLINPDGFPGDTSIGFGPLMTGTYMAKACDSSGNYSANEATFIVTEALLTGLTTLATATESPTFTGAKSNTVFIDSVLKLDSATTIDSMSTLMDSWGSFDSIGGVSGTGTYTFANKIDLGSTIAARLFSSIDSLSFDADDLIDSRTNNIDDWGPFDGADIEDAECQLMVSTTDDDPASGGATWSAYHALGHVADYKFRGFRFRLDFATASATHNRQVSALSVTAKH